MTRTTEMLQRRSAHTGVLAVLAVLALAAVAACERRGTPPRQPPPVPTMTAPPPIPMVAAPPPPTAAEADAFIQQVNVELRKLLIDAQRTAWIKATYITDDTEKIEAQAHERVMDYLSRKIKEARRYAGLQLSYDVARQLYLLAYSAGLPAPSDPRERAELAEIASKLEGVYGKGKYCSPKLKGKGNERSSDCLSLEELSDVLAKERDYDLLLEAWRGWHTVAPPMRPMYARLVELGNKGAREIGFRDISEARMT
jgi:peptidyl-dipeptidase A